MSYEFYKIVHLASLTCLLLGLGILLGAFAVKENYQGPFRKWGFALHGTGIALLFISGFGLLARLQIMANLPSWVYGKMLIWLLMGLIIVGIKRAPKLRVPLLGSILTLVTVAAFLAVTKP